MDYRTYQEKCQIEKILQWLNPYASHEHLANIKEVSLDKYLAVAPDVYVMASMLRSVLLRAEEQRELARLTVQESIKPWDQLSDEEKISEAPLRKQYLAGVRAGHNMGTIELCNRIALAARQELDRYRLENSEYSANLVVDSEAVDELD